MLNYLKTLVIVSLSFVAAMEFLNVLSFSNNLLEKESVDTSFQPDPEAESVVFLGDSYAATVYARDSYANQYETFFKEKGYNFIDLSRPGLSLDETAMLLDSVYTTHSPAIPKLAIYYYTYINVRSFEKGPWANGNFDLSNKTRPQTTAGTGEKKETNWKERSATVLVFKDILHTLSLFFTGRPFPGTPAANHPKLNLKHKENLRQLFNSIQAEHVIVVVNTPFNYGPRIRSWEHYDVFKTMELNDNITLVQSIDIVDDDEHALSWRNGHPDQEAIDIIAERIMTMVDDILPDN